MRSALAALIALSVATLSQANDAKLSPELQRLAPERTVDVIVQYKQAPTAAHHARVVAAGGEFKRGLEIIRGAHYSIPAAQLEKLSNDPDVEFVSPDRAVFATAVPPYTGNPDYGWRTVGADLATSVFGVDGTGIGIAMVDSGVNDSNDLKDILAHNRVVYKGVFISWGSPPTTIISMARMSRVSLLETEASQSQRKGRTWCGESRRTRI